MADSEESSGEEIQLKINPDYASRYDNWREKEEYQKLKDKYGDVKVDDNDDDSSSSSEEDEDAEALTPQLEKNFLRTLAALKSRDPKIYNQDVKFFDEQGESSETKIKKTKSGGSSGDDESRKKSKPMFLKDYERKVIVQHGGKFVDDDDDENESGSEREDMKRPLNYFEEQESIRQSFKQVVTSVDDEDDDKLLAVRVKSDAEKAKDEEDYLEWLKGQKTELSEDKDTERDLDPLRKFWTDPKLADNERFLRDYLLNKQYLEEDDEGIPSYDEIIKDLEEDEKELDKEDEFEKKYNFRFEEPDSEFIKSYPRVIPETLRNRDTRRIKSRQSMRERKRLEKEKKREELKRLKNLKKKEILAKIDKLRETTGLESVGFTPDDVEGEFNEEQYDRMMKKVFDADYYDQQADDVKPVFTDDEETAEDWDNWQPRTSTAAESSNTPTAAIDVDGAGDGDLNGDGEEPYCEDPDFNMDADYDPSQKRVKQKKLKGRKRRHRELDADDNREFGPEWEQQRSGAEGEEEESERGGGAAAGRRRKSKFATALERPKPLFDSQSKSFEEYFDEYYGLDYEDIIGDLPVRFKYRKVIPNDFGLSVDEVLKVPDKELNTWVSVKKMSQYRAEDEEMQDVMAFQRKGRNQQKKLNILMSLREPEPTESTIDEAESRSQKTKKRKKKQRSTAAAASTEWNSAKDKNPTVSVQHHPPKDKRVRLETSEDKSTNKVIDKDGKKRHSRKDSKRSDIVNPTDSDATVITDLNSDVLVGSSRTSKKKLKQKKADRLLSAETVLDSVKEVAGQREAGEMAENSETSDAVAREEKKKKKKKKGKKKGHRKLPTISDERLKAYGINPKKFKYFHQRKLLHQSDSAGSL